MERHDPADYARNHWRKFESQEEHAERVQAAESEAGTWFAAATKAQLQTYNNTMAHLRAFSGPYWDRRRTVAKAVWFETTAGATELLNITADEIMRTGEVSEETALAWDVLIDLAGQEPERLPVTLTVVHPQPQAAL